MNALLQSSVGHEGFPAEPHVSAISEAGVETAIRAVLSYIGEDPQRDGLRETPSRMVKAFIDCFAGYHLDPACILMETFEEIDGCDEMVVLRRIPFHSHCEHDFAPIIGHAWVGYVPRLRVVGISNLLRLVDAYAARLQLQERMTAQIANTMEAVLKPQGVGVVIRTTHHCIAARGAQKGSDVVTRHMLGSFRDIGVIRHEFLSVVNACLRN